MKIRKIHCNLLPIPDYLDIKFGWENNSSLVMLNSLRERYEEIGMYEKSSFIMTEYMILATSIVLNRHDLRLLRIEHPLPDDKYFHRIHEYKHDGTVNNMFGCLW